MTKKELAIKAADLCARATSAAQIRTKAKAGLVMPDVADAAIKMRERLDAKSAPAPATPHTRLAAVAGFLEAALPGALTKREIARKARQDVARPGYEAALAETAAKAVKAAKKGNRGRAR
jgi:hypothetical protein